MPRGLDLSAIDQAVNANKMQKLQRDAVLSQVLRQQKADKVNAGIESAYAGAFNPETGDFDDDKLIRNISSVSPREGYAQKNNIAKQKTDSEAAQLKAMADKAKYGRDFLATVTPQDYQAKIAQLKQQGFAFAENAPPEYNPEWVKQNIMTADDFIKQNGGGDAVYDYIPTDAGIARANKRSNDPNSFELVLNPATGKPYMKSADSPNIRGAVKGAEARASAGYKINTDIPGAVYTDAQVADMTGGTPPANMQVNPQTQQVRDGGRRQILEQELANEQQALQQATTPEQIQAHERNIGLLNKELGNTSQGGIRVPTPEEQAALTQKAKDEAEYNAPEAVAKRQKAIAFKQTTAKNMLSKIDSVMKRVDGWTAGVGGNVMRKLPINSDAKDIVADLETLKASFGFDRLQDMRDMSPTGGALGQVAVQELTALQASVTNINAETQSPAQLKTNLEAAKKHYEAWLDTLNGEAGNILPKDATVPNADVLSEADKILGL